MDIIKNKSLPEEYGQLKHLQKLSFMGGGRYIKYIRDDMFDSVKLLNITEVQSNRFTIGYHRKTDLLQNSQPQDLGPEQQSKAGHPSSRYCCFIKEYRCTNPSIE